MAVVLKKCKRNGVKLVQETCSVRFLKKRLPIVAWLPRYNLEKFQGDLIAGLTVGLTVIPQGLAYAAVAELPLQYGLYSAFMGCFIYCLFGTSKDVTLGPTAIISLMTAEYAKGEPTLAIALCLCAGLVQFAMGVLQLGFLVNFMAFPVISGYMSAAALIIGCGQLKLIFGLKNVRRSFIWNIYDTFRKLPETNHWDLTLGIISFVILLIMKWLKDRNWDKDRDPFTPLTTRQRVGRKAVWLIGTGRNALIVIVTTILAGILFSNNIKPFTMTKDVPPGFPKVGPPSFSYQHNNQTVEGEEFLSNLGAGIAVLPLIAILETIAYGKAFASRNKYRIDATQELLALGIANIVSSFFGSYPMSCSCSRTAINSTSGVRTPLGGIFAGLLVILALAFIMPYFRYIPSAVLGAVIIASVINMFEYQVIPKQWRIHKPDLLVWMVCFLCVLFLGIQFGILVGVGLGLVIELYGLAKPGTKVDTIDCCPKIVVVKFDKGLSFPASDFIVTTIHDAGLDEPPYKPVILDFAHVSHLDFSVIRSLALSVEEYATNNTPLYFACVNRDLEAKLKKASIKNLQCFPTVQLATEAILDEGVHGCIGMGFNEGQNRGTRRITLGTGATREDGDVHQPILMTEVSLDHLDVSSDTGEVLQNHTSHSDRDNHETTV
ncbi:sodium-independent sulfate anion transporter-like isoform X1 [Branchiostoma floridae]|uniref:Sodium-independent sulfate anion transporter-like isoform X1 n=1 Tax=Branchiostoma floridae TaxID=7739 RepID=A0A9J7M765_BRAFL|nr:sodium-independent sulfate anion transporter-like isoform X1 [Branchiostoma floridae]